MRMVTKNFPLSDARQELSDTRIISNSMGTSVRDLNKALPGPYTNDIYMHLSKRRQGRVPNKNRMHTAQPISSKDSSR